MPFSSPQSILDHYTNGFKGYIPDPVHLEKFLASLPNATFATAGANIAGSGKGKLSTPYKSVLKFDKDAYEERQTTGDCVSMGTRNATDGSRAVQIDVGHLPEGWIARGATEAIYGSRNNGGEGMSGSVAAEFVHSRGGILLRKKYGSIDLSKYDANKGISWGTRGIPLELIQAAKEHQVKTTSQVNSVEQARDALANGYCLACSSNQGFSNKRDGKGFASPQGNWGHCMAWMACDDTGSEISFLVQNSWFKWNDGGMPEWGPIPVGSFLIHADVAARMLRAGGTFAFSHVVGFPPQKLPSYSTHTFL